MLGCVVGLLGAALLVKGVMRARRYAAYGYGGCGGHARHFHRHGPWGGPSSGPWGGPSGGTRPWDAPHDGPDGDDDVGYGGPILLRGVFERLRTTPGQERAILEALRELKGVMKKAAEHGRKAADAVGDAMAADELSTESMANAYAHVDDATEQLRSASFTALSKIHDALEPAQRKLLAKFLKRRRGLEDLADGV